MGREVCAPWADSSKLCNVGQGSARDCVDGDLVITYRWEDEDYLLAASNILYGRTCQLYPGLCTGLQVWPCIDSRCYSPTRPCAPCVRYDVILLPSELPIVEIEEITEDGVTLDPSAYRLERGRIVRIDGERWKRNSFGVPDAPGVETIVTYTAGQQPPMELQMATADLADELKRSCSGDSCALDPRVQSFARRGVSVELTDLEELLKSGATGIKSVDMALSVHGNCEQGSATMFDPAAPFRGLQVP